MPRPTVFVKLKCNFCNKKFQRIKWKHTQNERHNIKKYYCSAKCKNKFQSLKHGPNWNGGRSKLNGYVRIWQSKGKFVFEHRLVMEKQIGRKLKRGEVIHHINGDKLDNRIENLVLCISPGMHTAKHHPQKKQTHCKRGHEFTEDNIYYGKRGERNCKICNRLSAIRRRNKK